MRCARALPVLQLMPAAGSRSVLSPPRCWVDFPERMSGRTPFGSPHVGHPINHHVTGPSSVDPDKAGRRHAQRVSRTNVLFHGRQQMT
jgi:hypothetical protein